MCMYVQAFVVCMCKHLLYAGDVYVCASVCCNMCTYKAKAQNFQVCMCASLFQARWTKKPSLAMEVQGLALVPVQQNGGLVHFIHGFLGDIYIYIINSNVIYEYVCIYVYVYIYNLHICNYIYIYVYLYIYTHTYIHV
jgi:hypothetical protein